MPIESCNLCCVHMYHTSKMMSMHSKPPYFHPSLTGKVHTQDATSRLSRHIKLLFGWWQYMSLFFKPIFFYFFSDVQLQEDVRYVAENFSTRSNDAHDKGGQHIDRIKSHLTSARRCSSVTASTSAPSTCPELPPCQRVWSCSSCVTFHESG